MATNRLRVRALHTIGFVDKGDDPKAEVVFFKRAVAKMIHERDGKFHVMDGDKAVSSHDSKAEAEAAQEKLKGGAYGPTMKERLMIDVTKLDATAQVEFKKLTDRIAELEKAVPAPAPKPVPVPEAVQKQLDDLKKTAEDAQAEVRKLTDQRENEQFITKAKDLSLNADDFGSILRKISKAVTGDEMKKLETHLKALAAQVKESGLYKEIGRGGSNSSTDAETQVEELVKEIRKATPKLTREAAYGEVMKLRPDLRNQLEAERLARTSQPAEGRD